MPSWPLTLPELAVAGRYNEAPERFVATVERTVGDPPERLRSIIDTCALTLVKYMSGAQIEILRDFYHGQLFDGVLSFEYTHPRLRTPISVEFTSAPSWRAVDYDVYEVSLPVRRLA